MQYICHNIKETVAEIYSIEVFAKIQLLIKLYNNKHSCYRIFIDGSLFSAWPLPQIRVIFYDGCGDRL